MIIKKLIVIASLIFASNVMAIQKDYTATFTCPAVSGDFNIIRHFGDLIAGEGTEYLSVTDEISIVFFKSVVGNPTIPDDLILSGYFNNGTSYNSATGDVGCSYNTLQIFDSIRVFYTMINGMGGIVLSSTDDSISISLITGLKK